MYIIVTILVIIVFSLVGEIFSWDAVLISASIIVAACIIGSTIEEQMTAFISTIKEQMETRQNSDSKDEDGNNNKRK